MEQKYVERYMTFYEGANGFEPFFWFSHKDAVTTGQQVYKLRIPVPKELTPDVPIIEAETSQTIPQPEEEA